MTTKWKIESNDKMNEVTCPRGHSYMMKEVKYFCPTCNVTGYYLQLLETLNSMTGLVWLVDQNKQTRGVFCDELKCKVGAKYGKFYDKRIKLDVEMTTKYPSVDGFMYNLKTEIKEKITHFCLEKQAGDSGADLGAVTTCLNSLYNYKIDLDPEIEIAKQQMMTVSYDPGQYSCVDAWADPCCDHAEN